MQQLTYLGVMYLLVPVLIVTGWFLLFPGMAPDRIAGHGGIWPMAVLHLVVAFFGTLFVIGHIYLATAGHTVTSNFESMVTGYHKEEENR